MGKGVHSCPWHVIHINKCKIEVTVQSECVSKKPTPISNEHLYVQLSEYILKVGRIKVHLRHSVRFLQTHSDNLGNILVSNIASSSSRNTDLAESIGPIIGNEIVSSLKPY